ncbi:unnamed protein product [Brachionus calyciflorus]|uniref:Uncharacterized protein n=1 Tax=Brachionus calyciflorus TaxID=104777 RepID=A0A814MTB4_9BILA|nr:unnamed protein product [Brachionus calyciflorus]
MSGKKTKYDFEISDDEENVLNKKKYIRLQKSNFETNGLIPKKPKKIQSLSKNISDESLILNSTKISTTFNLTSNSVEKETIVNNEVDELNNDLNIHECLNLNQNESLNTGFLLEDDNLQDDYEELIENFQNSSFDESFEFKSPKKK